MNNLRHTLRKFTQVSEEEIDHAMSFSITKEFKKGEKLFEKNSSCEDLMIIEKGFAVMYHEKAGLRKGVIGFFKEGNYIGDFCSVLTQKPIKFNFHFIEDTRLGVISLANLAKISKRTPMWERFGRKLAEKAYLNEMTHLVDAKFLSKVERYKNMVENENYVLQRAPLYLLASYLDTTPETLSRIRRRIYERGKKGLAKDFSSVGITSKAIV